MSSHAYINGIYKPNYVAKVSINDRSIHFADAVYEVVAVYNRNLVFWQDHIVRLKYSLANLDIKFNKSYKSLFYIVKELIKLNDFNEGIIYIHISRGIAKRNHNWTNDIKPSLMISCIKKKIFDLNQKKISLISDEDIRWRKCHIKSVSLLPNIILKQKALKNNAFECLLKDKEDFITEATTSNIWILRNKTLVTTPLESNILAGVTRKKIIEIAKLLNIKLVEKRFKETDIYSASGVFLTNSSSMIIEANKLNKKKLRVDDSGIIKLLKTKMKETIANEK